MVSATEQGAALRSVDSGRAGRWMESRKPIVVQADAVVAAECNTGEVKTQGRSPGTSTSRLTGIGDIGMYARTAQEPGRSCRLRLRGRNVQREATSVSRDGGKSERRSKSKEMGEPIRRDPVEQRAAP